MKDKLIRYAPFQLYESTSFEEYLAEMSLKGWLIEKIASKGFLTFRKSVPLERSFCVDIFSEASDLDSTPGWKTREYIEMCRAAGWEFLCERGKLLIFVANGDNPIPIQTDDDLWQRTVSNEAWKNFGAFIFMAVMYSFLMMSNMRSSSLSYTFSHYSSLFLMLAILGTVCFNLSLVIDFAIWRIKMQIDSKAGRTVLYRSGAIRLRIFSRRLVVSVVMLSAIITFIALYMEIEMPVAFWMRLLIPGVVMILIAAGYLLFIRMRRGIVRKTYIVIVCVFLCFGMFAVIFYDFNGIAGATPYDALPLTAKDIGISLDGTHEYAARVEQTFLASSQQYSDLVYDQTGRSYGITYSIFSSPIGGILDNYIMQYRNLRWPLLQPAEQMDAIWKALEVYMGSDESGVRYLVVYNDAVVEFWSDIPVSQEQTAVICSRLHSAAVETQ